MSNFSCDITKVSINDFTKYSYAVLIDVSWVLHKSAYTYGSLEYNNIKTGNIYGLLKSVRSFLSWDNNCAVILVRDGKPIERKKLCESSGIDYKAGRGNHDDVYNYLMDAIIMASMSDRVFYSYNNDKEADDNIYCIAKQLHSIGVKCIIHSGDNDLLQTLTEDNSISIARKWVSNNPIFIHYENVINDKEFTNKFLGIPPNKLPLFRSLVGDSSDNIKGIYRLPKKVAFQWVSKSNNLKELQSIVESNNDKWSTTVTSEWDKVENNYSIMKLQDNYTPLIGSISVNRDTFEHLILRYGMFSYLNFIDNK